jgi:hypothetical protein
MMKFVQDMLLHVMQTRVLPKLLYRVITRDNEDPYLVRWLLCEFKGYKIYIHKFLRSDMDRELHNHPWSFGLSLILKGGYIEERLVLGTPVTSHVYLPGDWNWISPECFHRVDLITNEAWSIILVGPRVREWGFVDRDNLTFVDWISFINHKEGRVVPTDRI